MQSGTNHRFWWRAVDRSAPAQRRVVFSGPLNVRGPDDAVSMPFVPVRGSSGASYALIAGLSGALVFAAATGFGRSARLAEPLSVQIDRIMVEAGLGISEVALIGHRYTTDTEIHGALGLETAGSLLVFDVVSARRRVLQLPWVATAEINRVFPDRLRVTVAERQPIAIFEYQGRSTLVDRTGRQLADLGGAGRLQLPRITGDGAPAAIAQLLKSLEPYGELAAKLEVAHRVGGRRWTLDLAGGGRVLLPAERDGEALLRLQRHQSAGGLKELAAQTIDLRQDGLITLSGGPAASSSVAKPGQQRPTL